MSSDFRPRCSSTCWPSASPGCTALGRALLVVLPASAILVAGCGSGRETMLVRERLEAVQAPHRVAGTTNRAGQVVTNDCRISAVYKVREATGTAFLTQSKLVHLLLRAEEGDAVRARVPRAVVRRASGRRVRGRRDRT